MSDESFHIPFSMWRAALLIGMHGFLYGYCFSCLNSTLVAGDNKSESDCYNGEDDSCPKGTIYNDIDLNTIEAQLATALTVLGAWIGCLLGSKPSEKYGRKRALLMNNFFFISGAVLACLGNIYTLFIGRFISGLGVGACSTIAPVLLSEIATPSTRGTITTVMQLMITTGILMSAVLSYGFVTYVEHGWQYIQSFAAVPAVIILVMHNYLPESPKWYVAQGQKHMDGTLDHSNHRHDSIDYTEEARKSLMSIRPENYNVDAELSQLSAEAKMDAAMAAGVTWKEVFANKTAVIIGCGLMFFQAITGINSVIFYSTTIFELAGFDESIIGTLVVSVIQVMITIISSYLIDRSGRKILLLVGSYIMLFALMLLSTVLLSPIEDTAQGYVAVLALLLFVVGFSVGLGPVCWTVVSEIMPTRLRTKAVSLFLSINWCSNLIISMLTLTAINGMGGVESGMDDDEEASAQKKGVAFLYIIFAGFTVLCVLFIHTKVPETKGKNPEDFNAVPVTSPLIERDEDRY